MAGLVTSIYLRADERAAVDALADELGCRRGDLVRLGLRWLYGRHPDEVRRRLADLPRNGRGLNLVGREAERWADVDVPRNEASRPMAGTARETSLIRSDDGQDTGAAR